MNDQGYAWFQINENTKRCCPISSFEPVVQDTRYVRWRPLTLEHLEGGPVKFESQRDLKQHLKSKGLFSHMFS